MFRHIGAVSVAILFATLLGGCLVAPKPYTTSEFEQMAAADLAEVTANQEPLTKPVDLYEAMARALKYNLNYRVEAARTNLRMAELDLAHYSMLVLNAMKSMHSRSGLSDRLHRKYRASPPLLFRFGLWS